MLMAFTLKSPAFAPGDRIPKRHSAEGDNVSPTLEWSEVPAGTRELALVCDDPDAPQDEPWVHWLVYKIPPSLGALPELAVKGEGKAPDLEVVEGRNSWGKVGYGGPLPPKGHGTHHYNFTLYALDEPLHIRSGASKDELLASMKGHTVGQATLTGIYSR
jgi:Raf kinase inhibitor-like YbhB/YbcL family protein